MSILVVAASAGFAVEWIRLNESSAFPYRGGFFLADVMVGLVILGVRAGAHRAPRPGAGLPPAGLHREDLLRPLPVALAGDPGDDLGPGGRGGLAALPAPLGGGLRAGRALLQAGRAAHPPGRHPVVAGLGVHPPGRRRSPPACCCSPPPPPPPRRCRRESPVSPRSQHQQLAAAGAFGTNPVRFALLGDSMATTLIVGLNVHPQTLGHPASLHPHRPRLRPRPRPADQRVGERRDPPPPGARAGRPSGRSTSGPSTPR